MLVSNNFCEVYGEVKNKCSVRTASACEQGIDLK